VTRRRLRRAEENALTELSQAEFDNCAAEPIRIPGGIQPHGALLVLDPGTGVLLQASVNAAAMLSLPLALGSTPDLPQPLTDWIQSGSGPFLEPLLLAGKPFNVSGHVMPQGAIVELEPALKGQATSLDAIFPQLQAFADEILPIVDIRELGTAVARQIMSIAGFNRVMVYSFDPEWHGTVIAESGDGVLPSYLDLRFPATDIPAQARELYRLSPLRLIPNADYTPVPLLPVISPVDGQPLDLSFAALRSVSPVHLQYMRNMGTYASMSISIIVDGKLRGLISCHNQAAHVVSPQVRSACDFVGKILSLQVASIQRGAHDAQRIALKRRETSLVPYLSQAKGMAEELARHGDAWMSLTNAAGAAIVTDEEIRMVGETPPRDALLRLAARLHQLGGDRIDTDHLSAIWDQGASYKDVASGVLAIAISQLHPSFVMWFRPEVVRTVTWGGDPRKPADPLERLSPRSSFEQWKEVVHARAQLWTPAEIESADDFRNALINFVLRRAEERAELSDELEQSNRELEAFSYSVSHDLRAPFRHIVGYAELLAEREADLDEKSRHYLRNISEAALSAGRLVDDLLAFSQLGRATLAKTRIDMNKLVEEVRRSIEPDYAGRDVEWQIDRLPPAWDDGSLIRQALANLIENAIKYSRDRSPAIVEISGEQKGNHAIYRVRDNGVGFEMAYVDKLFGVFQRLHRAEEFPGTGIGLALTKRIVVRHGGTVGAEGIPGVGATFIFSLPSSQENLR
jgi:light-regulated signal transduction histidine kinase (bacteriophytochrome)